jgi:hypothetical protein
MRTDQFASTTLVALFRGQQIATMEEMKAALGTSIDRTVFRKLGELSYCTSYSDCGKFYTIPKIARFDDRGLWTHRGIHFSKYGSLIDTVEKFVSRSDRGFLSSELTEELQVQVKDPLLKLVTLGRLAREEFSGLYLYCSPDRRTRNEQLRRRKAPITEPRVFGFLRDRHESASDETKAAILLFLSTLEEGQRRLYAGLESLRLGHGGDRCIADLLGMDVHTIAHGRQDLLARDVHIGRSRRPGGGRKAIEKKLPKSSPHSRK